MVDIPEIRGAIFDIDDTLLDNNPLVNGEKILHNNLHQRAKLIAVKRVGEEKRVQQLIDMTAEESYKAFVEADVHTIEAGIINMMIRAGLTKNLVEYLEAIVAEKDRIYGEVLLREGEPVDGAVEFVQGLAKAKGIEDKMAIASTATRSDIKLFLGKSGLYTFFPDERIKSKESVTRPKPDPEVYRAAFESLGMPGLEGNVLALEDDPKGIESARRVGLFVCAITTRYSQEELEKLKYPPHIIADSYADFSDTFGLAA